MPKLYFDAKWQAMSITICIDSKTPYRSAHSSNLFFAISLTLTFSFSFFLDYRYFLLNFLFD